MKSTWMRIVTLGALLAAGLVLGGCSSSSGADPAKLEGTWVLESFGGAKSLTPADPTVTTTLTMRNGQSGGNGGVNSYGGTYEAEPGNLSFSDLTATLMAGPENAMQQESKFFSALSKTEHFEFDGDKLVLSDVGNNTLAVLKPK